jgi:putative ABC transport system permease protein
VFTVFGLLALVLTAVGLYGVIAYNVTQRRHELGVRLALGAQRLGVVRLIVSESIRVALAGVAIGSVVSRIGGRWIAPLLFRQSPRDRLVFAFVIVALVAVSTVAGWVPALRAARLDPKSPLKRIEDAS